MLDAGALIEKHRGKGVLVDSNLLVLFVVGTVNRSRIQTSKRTSGFTGDDFELLTRLIGLFGKLIATPHVLSQVSDLTDLKHEELRRSRQVFAALVQELEEVRDASVDLIAHPVFERLGLADAAIATVCLRGVLVLTADLDLYLALQERGADALNFNHVRQLSWSL